MQRLSELIRTAYPKYPLIRKRFFRWSEDEPCKVEGCCLLGAVELDLVEDRCTLQAMSAIDLGTHRDVLANLGLPVNDEVMDPSSVYNGGQIPLANAIAFLFDEGKEPEEIIEWLEGLGY